MKINSIDQLMTTTILNGLVQNQFPKSTVINTDSGSIGGEKTIESTFAYSNPTSGKLITTLIFTVHDNTSYNLIFMANDSDKSQALSDFQSIINSFQFKTSDSVNNNVTNLPVTKVTNNQPVQTAQGIHSITISTPVAGQNIQIGAQFRIDFTTANANTDYYDYYLIPANVSNNYQPTGTNYFDKIVEGYNIGGFHLGAPSNHIFFNAAIPNDIPSGNYKLRIYEFTYPFMVGGTESVSSAIALSDSGYFTVTN